MSLERPSPAMVGHIMLAAVLVAAALQTRADAHSPADAGYQFTCSGGEGLNSQAGNCWQHHSNADARFYIHVDSIYNAGYLPGVNAGYQIWDQTDGHQFNFIKETTDTTSNARVSATSSEICGKPTAVGCTSMGVSGDHSVEGSATIKFKTGIASDLVDDVAAHEFGHYVSLGHSDVSSATMWPTAASGQSTLHSSDRLGRCEIYGHSHGYWGGC